MFENLIEILKANPRKIVYTEGHDARILESAARLKKGAMITFGMKQNEKQHVLSLFGRLCFQKS